MIAKNKKETIERVTIKIPKSLADYFRKTFPHGKRSKFFAQCLLNFKHDQEVEIMENNLRKVGKKRQ